MKPQIYKSIALVVMLLSMVFVVADAAAKKPVKPPPINDDPCSNLEVFSPDFAFWRSTGKKRTPEVTIYLAESGSGCEKPLVEVFGSSSYIWDLRYSNHLGQDGSVDVGRVTWVNSDTKAIWMQDFGISGTEIVRANDAELIIFNASLDNPNVTEYLSALDLSPDMETLVIDYGYQLSDGSGYSSIKVIDVVECLELEEGCPSNNLQGLEFAKIDRSEPGWITAPSWGPLGIRIYAKWRIDGDDLSTAIRYYDLGHDNDGKWVLNGEGDLISYENHPDQPWMSWMAFPFSGWHGDKESLAVHAAPTANESCENVYVIDDVSDCMGPDANCRFEKAFVGQFPTWTKNGEIIHLYGGWTLSTRCDFEQVGVWTTDDLKPLMEGKRPNAASGLPE